MKTLKVTVTVFLFLVFCLFSTSILHPQSANIKGDDAVITSQKVPESMDREHVYTAEYTVKNTGTTTWKTGIYQLKIYVTTSVVSDDLQWRIPNINIPNDVSPGSEVTLTTKVEVWHQNGDYTFTAQMSRSDTAFGTSSTPVTVNVH